MLSTIDTRFLAFEVELVESQSPASLTLVLAACPLPCCLRATSRLLLLHPHVSKSWDASHRNPQYSRAEWLWSFRHFELALLSLPRFTACINPPTVDLLIRPYPVVPARPSTTLPPPTLLLPCSPTPPPRSPPLQSPPLQSPPSTPHRFHTTVFTVRALKCPRLHPWLR